MPTACPLLGIEPKTRACALTEKLNRSPLSPHLLGIVFLFPELNIPVERGFKSFRHLDCLPPYINFFLLLLWMDISAQAAITKISTWMVWTVKIYASHIGRLRRPKLSLQQILCQVRSYFLVHRQMPVFSLCPAVEEGARELLEISFIRVLIQWRRLHPHGLIPSHGPTSKYHHTGC